MKYTFDETIYLKTFCESCKKKNGGCIKNPPYLDLCVKNDADELVENYRETKRRNYSNMDKDIMELSVDNLEERKLEFLKEHSREILFKIIDLIDAEKFDVIQTKKVAEADDDCGDVIHFINFAYNNDKLDIYQIVEMMRDLRKGINERKRKLTNGN